MYSLCIQNRVLLLIVATTFNRSHFTVGLKIQVEVNKAEWTEKATLAAKSINQSLTPPTLTPATIIQSVYSGESSTKWCAHKIAINSGRQHLSDGESEVSEFTPGHEKYQTPGISPISASYHLPANNASGPVTKGSNESMTSIDGSSNM